MLQKITKSGIQINKRVFTKTDKTSENVLFKQNVRFSILNKFLLRCAANFGKIFLEFKKLQDFGCNIPCKLRHNHNRRVAKEIFDVIKTLNLSIGLTMK